MAGGPLHKDLLSDDLHGAKAFPGSGTPVGVRTPGVVGELYFDSTNKNLWSAFGLTNADWQLIGGVSSSTAFKDIVGGRLSLVSGNPLAAADQLAKTSVFWEPHNSNEVALYTGTAWEVKTFSSGLSVAVPSTTTTPFDVFAFISGGVVTLETANWTNDSTRATALTRQDGVLVKSGATTRRYLGTGRTTGVSGQCEDSAAKRFLINYYNAVQRRLHVVPGYSNDNLTTSYSHTSTSFSEVNGGVNSRVEFLLPVEAWGYSVTMHLVGDPPASNSLAAGISALNDASTAVREQIDSARLNATLHYNEVTSEGYKFLAMLARLGVAGTATIFADDIRAGGTVDPELTYMAGHVMG